jgi:phosphoesterase RecJ-like protein
LLGLPLAGEVRRAPRANVAYDLVIAVDCGDESRMGNAYACLPDPKPVLINIDHHVTNTRFGAAASLLTGIVTDTMGFRTTNVSAGTLRAAADLVEAGADIAAISLNALHQRPMAVAKIWSVGLGRMKLEDGLLWTSIPRGEYQKLGLDGNPSSAGLVNFLADMDEAVMGVVLTETNDGPVRVTMRARPPYNVAEVAGQFGGGGHALAAGCTLAGPLEQAEARLVAACREAISRQTPSTP